MGAIERLHNSELNGRPIFVREDRESGMPLMQNGQGHTGGGGGMMGMGPMMNYHQQHHAHHHPLPHHMVHAPLHSPRMHHPRGQLGTRVYVGNLSYEVAWQDLKDHMRRVSEL
jgi:RNA recognition motif-containing protein